MKHTIFFFVGIQIFISSFYSVSFSQEIKAVKIEDTIVIDGRLDEPEWDNADEISGFTQYEPRYNEPSTFGTTIKILYSNKRIYFGVVCSDPEAGKISAKSTGRDGEVWEDDSMALIIDTFNDGNNAYMFMFNSIGTQQDERWADNGRTRDLSWDAGWMSAGSVSADGWSAEISVPYDALIFDSDLTEWGFNAIRWVPRNREMSLWIDDLSEWFRIGEFGTITGLDLSNVTGKRFTAIPYAQSQLVRGDNTAGDLGGDLRISLSSSVGLDATINPDFATVEGDVEQVNFTRFELSFPEKRPFFMEGSENYRTRIQQFYSRRIGEIPWGVKLNGKIGNWKVNMLNTQSDPSSANPNIDPGDDALYSVFRVNRELENSSNIGIIGANRNYNNDNKGSLGLVSTLFFTDNLGMTAQAIKSYGDYSKGTWTYFLRPSFDSKTGHFHVRYSHTGENVRENMNDIGFIRDDDRREVDSNVRKIFWVNKYGIDDLTSSINYNRYWSQTGILRSWDISNSLSLNFLKRWSFSLNYNEDFKLFEKEFNNNSYEARIGLDNRQGNSVNFSFRTGKNFDRDFERYGTGFSLNLSEAWNMNYQINRFWFSPDLEDDNGIIHFVRSTYYLNKDLFYKLFYQSRYSVSGGIANPEFDLTRETIQFVFVWRFLPPFGSLQLAYQQGTTRVTEVTGKNRTFFSKLSWVF